MSVYEVGVVGIEEAAAYLGKSSRTLRRMIARGEHVPGLMPRRGREPWEFSKPVMQRHVEGGYVNSLRVLQRRRA